MFLCFFVDPLKLLPSLDGAELWDTFTSVVPVVELGAEADQVAAKLAAPVQSAFQGAPAPKSWRRRAL